MTLKNFGTTHEKARVLYVAQGFKDRDKPYMVHDVSTLIISSIRMVLSVVAVKVPRLFSHEITKAYLQSKPHLSRQVFIRQKERDREVLGLKYGHIFELLRPLYGLCDAGDYCGIQWRRT